LQISLWQVMWILGASLYRMAKMRSEIILNPYCYAFSVIGIVYMLTLSTFILPNGFLDSILMARVGLTAC
ncbi:MAG: hypothetical protein KUG80_08610, partial [Gammaproteobacteria bacterium]|nr:hypothetical protein [Gammaproteobacteria bacterium]